MSYISDYNVLHKGIVSLPYCCNFLCIQILLKVNVIYNFQIHFNIFCISNHRFAIEGHVPTVLVLLLLMGGGVIGYHGNPVLIHVVSVLDVEAGCAITPGNNSESTVPNVRILYLLIKEI